MSKVRKRINQGKEMKKPPVMRAHHKRQVVKIPRGQAKYNTVKHCLQGGGLF